MLFVSTLFFFFPSSRYGRQLNVEEGFETVFKFRMAEGSVRCNAMDDAYTHCRARGGDGLAFVVQVTGYMVIMID